jgi:hypothetical protein
MPDCEIRANDFQNRGVRRRRNLARRGPSRAPRPAAQEYAVACHSGLANRIRTTRTLTRWRPLDAEERGSRRRCTARGDRISVSRPYPPAFVAATDTPLIGERTAMGWCSVV